MRILVALLLSLLLAGCGFHLRGPQVLPFESLYIAMPQGSELGAALKRSIRASNGTRLVESPQEAEAVFTPVMDAREKVILSLSSAGRVREYQLRQRFAFRVSDAKGQELLAPREIQLHRDITFDETQLLAKEQEEVFLYRDMQNDLVQQILRRLAAAKSAG